MNKYSFLKTEIERQSYEIQDRSAALHRAYAQRGTQSEFSDRKAGEVNVTRQPVPGVYRDDQTNAL